MKLNSHLLTNAQNFLSQKNAILSVSTASVGGVLTVTLFIFCFIVVHFLLLAKIGWQTSVNEKKTKEEAEKKKQEAPAPPKKEEREPIYYIVEKKRAKAKPRTVYSEPREFKFKSDR